MSSVFRSAAELDLFSRQLRAKIVEVSGVCHVAHLGSALSCVDILSVLYSGMLRIDSHKPRNPDRDRFILSKGHAALAWYTVLAHSGFFPVEDLDQVARPGSHLGEHPSCKGQPGVEAATGSLGHGLPLGVGMALAAKVQQRSYNVVALLSDGECNEGSVWEAAMFAAAKKLENLTAIVDFNKWQATGRSEEILALSPLVDKWKSFGWNAVEIDGHDHQQIITALERAKETPNQPTAIVAHTVKGKGISFMEDDNNWHYRIPNADEIAQAKQELRV